VTEEPAPRGRHEDMRRTISRLGLPALAALVAAVAFAAPADAAPITPYTLEVGCTIPLNDYICTTTTTPLTRRFVVETVSFSGQATNGQTVGANFTYKQGGKAAFVWLPVTSFGPSPSAGTGLYATSFGAILRVDARSSIRLEVYRNISTNAGQNSPYVQRLNLMGYLQ
jgi:hypothetical protein